MRNFLYSLPAALAVLMAGSGCLSTQTVSPMAESLDSLGISLQAVRESNIRFAYRDGLVIEQAADSIIATSTDRTTKINAYLWKIYCIPVIRQVYAQSDPIASRIDALAFAMQCDAYFRTGYGKNRFGASQSIALNATDANLRRMLRAVQAGITMTDFDSLLSKTSRWAAAHTLNNHVFERPSIVAEMGDLLAGRDYSIGSAVGRIADDVDDLSSRLTVFAAQLPREARWQGEYLLADLALRERLTTLDTTIAALATSLTRIEEGLTAGEIVVDIASFRSLHSDIRAALELASAERAIVVAEAERIRLAVLAEGELAVGRRLGDAMNRAEAIVNRVLWKIGLALAAGLGGALLVILLTQRLWRR